MKNSIRRISQLIPKIPAVAAALLALSALSSQAIADGTETLGPPSIPIASGTDVIIAGTGLSLLQPDNIAINIPAGSTVKQVLLYWEGRDTIPTPDDTIIVNGIPVTGALIGGPVFWTPNGTTNFGYSFTYRADVSALGLVADGPSANVISAGGLSYNFVNNGAGLFVIVDDGSPASHIDVRDGNDLAFFQWAPPKDTTVPQTFIFPASTEERTAKLSMIISAVSGTASSGGTFRPTAIDVTVGGVTTEHNNVLDSLDGQEWDSVVLPVTIPAGETMVKVQVFSVDRLFTGARPASLTWNAGSLSIEPPPRPRIEICTLVTLNPDMVSDFSDADMIAGDSCDAFPQGIPVGVVGMVDGTYRLKVTNTGSEKLVNVRITSPDFGLVNEPIPAICGDLDPGEMCTMNFGDPGYPSLKVLDVCQAPGQVNKIASVDGDGAISGIPVSDDDPAIVDCLVEPHITLRKEVSLDGGPFLDANTAASGPSGMLGADALYRLIVENDGTETLVGAIINDAVLGLVNVAVPGGPMAPGDIRVITSGEAGFGPLLFIDRCDSVGSHLNVARVDATGQISGAPVDAEDPAWVNCENPRIELLKQVSLNGIDFFDADAPGDPDVPVGIVGFTDATYRLIVTNIGTETLTSVLVEDATLGVSTFIADLAPGETRVLESGDAGFGNLFQAMRCGNTPGIKSNIATVDAAGLLTGTPVSDDNPANIRCIVGPAIQLLKQVSLTGAAPFFDADTAATGPTGLLGADATYRLIVRNIGDEDLTNVTIDDGVLGIAGAVVPDLPIGAEVVIDVGSLGGFQELFFPGRCDSIGTKLNIADVHANGQFTGQPVSDSNPANVNCEAPPVCSIAVDKTCVVAPPTSDDLICTSSIAATTLRYTGPSLDNATVTFEGKDHGFAEYVGVNLVSHTTVLTMAGQNGYTVDGTLTGDKMGAQTTITINGVVEIIHTSCSAIYVAGEPAPLDAGTPNPPNSAKGDPSPNWSVVNFLQKDGVVIEENPDDPVGADACVVPTGGADVTYLYSVTNTGTTNAAVTSVFDDKLGELLAVPPALLAPGDTLMLTEGPVVINEDTTNVVNVTTNVVGDPAAVCSATDSVEVTVEPPPLLSCADGKPVELVWEYTGMGCDPNPANPQGGKFTCSGDPLGASPVQLVVENANADPSTETIQIGDFVSVTPSGDKFDSQTDFSIMQGGVSLQDLSMHLSCSQDLNVGDEFGGLTLRIFVPGQGGGGMGGGMGGMGGMGM